MEHIITKIKEMLEDTNKLVDNAAAGFDEGYYSGKCEGLEEVLKLLIDSTTYIES